MEILDMGFWHTGYFEFHEVAGLGILRRPAPPRFYCNHCVESYASLDDLRSHRFDAHPLKRPVMFVLGQELGAHPTRITRRLTPADVRLGPCDKAVLNGRTIEVSAVPKALARVTTDTCQIVLTQRDVDAAFVLEFRVASERDLLGVEEQFMNTARDHRLDMRAVDGFISAASGFGSAIGYCDGICAYLYGVLAKEQSADSSLPYSEYAAKFSAAAEELAAYERPLAQAIGSTIDFHFNHFSDSVRRWPGSRIGAVAHKYLSLIDPRTEPLRNGKRPKAPGSDLDSLVTDWDTERIIRWGVRTLKDLSEEVDDMETFLRRDIAEFDKVKMHMLLGEVYRASKEPRRAREHAAMLRNVPTVESWAERLIQSVSGGERA